MNEKKAPTGWIVATVVCAVAAVGLAVWAFTTSSDRDDANKKVEQQQRTIAKQQRTIAQQKQQLGRDVAARARLIARARRVYRRTHRRLVRERGKASSLQAQVNNEAGQLNTAKQQVADADSVAERREAQLRQAHAETAVAAACARAAVDSLQPIFQSADPIAGLDAAASRLKALEKTCAQAVG